METCGKYLGQIGEDNVRYTYIVMKPCAVLLSVCRVIVFACITFGCHSGVICDIEELISILSEFDGVRIGLNYQRHKPSLLLVREVGAVFCAL